MTRDQPPRGASARDHEAGGQGMGERVSTDLFMVDDIVSFPTVIETSSDEPVLLSELLSADFTGDSTDFRIVSIDGRDVSGATPLPGVRIGADEGTGFILRRQQDGELVYIPDADYCGITTFTFTIADRLNQEATLLATLSVRGTTSEPVDDISFADGTFWASVTEGVESTILGALTFASADPGDKFLFKVFEGDTSEPSKRFSVIGDKLHATEPLDHLVDGTIMLRVVAEDGSMQVGSSQLAIEVRPTPGSGASAIDQFRFDSGRLGSSEPASINRHLSLVTDVDDESDFAQSGQSTYVQLDDATAAQLGDATAVADGIARGPASDVESL